MEIFEKIATRIKPCNFKSKTERVGETVNYWLCRIGQMIDYTNLPDSIPEHIFKLQIQTNGYVVIPRKEYTDGLYRSFSFDAKLGGLPDIYYRPTRAIISNPSLSKSLDLTIGVDAFIIPNDSLYMGFLPLFNKWATMLIENELSMRTTLVNARALFLINAVCDKDKLNADKFLSDIEEGKNASIASNAFFGGIKSQPLSSQGTLSNLLSQHIETEQYIKASLYNDVGVNANYNMKRESINGNEADLNNDSLFTLIDDMIAIQTKAFDIFNEATDNKVEVKKSSIWDRIEEKYRD